MKIVTVINAKGGCGKSTIAMSLASGLAIRGLPTLLIDMDPQAQVTQWLSAGDGLSSQGTLVAAMEGKATLDSVIQPTKFENLSFVASSQGLEDLGRQITEMEGYQTILTRLLSSLTRSFEFIVIDSPIAERPRRVYHPSVLHLSSAGHTELHSRGLLRDYPQVPSFEKRSRVSDFTMRHELAIMDLKAAFMKSARDSASCQVHEFSTWPLLSQFTARPRVLHEILVKPDGFIHLTQAIPNNQSKRHWFYLEIDRSSEPQATLATRAACYMDHFRRGGLAQRYQQSRDRYKEYPFRVLMVFPNAERRNNAAAKMLLLNPPVLTLTWLTTMAEAISDPLGKIWIQPVDYRRVVGGTEFEPRQARSSDIYRRQSERERLVEDRVTKHALF